jgi:hypothetical protein
LEKRLSMMQSDTGDQRQETTETIESLNPSAPGEGWKIERKVIEKSQPIGSNQTERKMGVLKPDLNGGMQIIHNQMTIDKK